MRSKNKQDKIRHLQHNLSLSFSLITDYQSSIRVSEANIEKNKIAVIKEERRFKNIQKRIRKLKGVKE